MKPLVLLTERDVVAVPLVSVVPNTTFIVGLVLAKLGAYGNPVGFVGALSTDIIVTPVPSFTGSINYIREVTNDAPPSMAAFTTS